MKPMSPLRDTARAATVALLMCLASPARAQAASPSGDTPDRDVSMSLQARVPDGFTIATVGDLQLTHPLATLRDPGFQSVVALIRGASVALGNLETTLFDPRHFSGYPAWTTDALRPVGTPGVARDLKAMGFAMVSRANNHTLDWSIAGMRETDRLLDAAGLVHAGTGNDLSAARAAGYLETPAGRIALISVTSTFIPIEPALPSAGEAPARPGASALRTSLQVTVDAQAMQALRRLQSKLPAGAVDTASKSGPVTLFGTTYGQSAGFGFHYTMNAEDLRGILQAIRQAKLTSDLLVVNIHAHEPGNWSLQPPDFLPEFAHAAIDAGADIVVGEGPHQLRGIEIYQGRPIFYSLGNFFFQIAPQQPVAADLYDELGANPGQLTDAELNQSRIGVHVEDDSWAIAYQSVVAVTTFRADRAAAIRLYPIALTKHGRLLERGVPHVAPPDVARAILQRLEKLSEPYGTRIQVRNGLGFISLGR